MFTYICGWIIGVVMGIVGCILVLGFRYPKHVGTILMNDSNGLYVELDNEDSLNTLYDSDTVIFSVKRTNKHK